MLNRRAGRICYPASHDARPLRGHRRPAHGSRSRSSPRSSSGLARGVRRRAPGAPRLLARFSAISCRSRARSSADRCGSFSLATFLLCSAVLLFPGVRAGRRASRAPACSCGRIARWAFGARAQDPADRALRLRACPHDELCSCAASSTRSARARASTRSSGPSARARSGSLVSNVATHRHQRRRHADGARRVRHQHHPGPHRAPASPAWRSALARKRWCATSSAASS